MSFIVLFPTSRTSKLWQLSNDTETGPSNRLPFTTMVLNEVLCAHNGGRLLVKLFFLKSNTVRLAMLPKQLGIELLNWLRDKSNKAVGQIGNSSTSLRLSVGSTAHIEEGKRELAGDMHRLARPGVRLRDSTEGGIVMMYGSDPSFVSEVKGEKDPDPILLEFRIGKQGKLSPRLIGFYRIAKMIGSVAYELELPQELAAVHPIFHISMLKKRYPHLFESGGNADQVRVRAFERREKEEEKEKKKQGFVKIVVVFVGGDPY
ncbi:hypothetical protein MTR67_053556 [Solanum verrucosum]|uniref:Tf2-1-like SH3-like domain-containing protein n=1 Tax=Solanum verrucosum TaxID=315347 RepID=A0AAF0VAQ0_SOLVR|nr:hypothetical protein MTR67_053556 [Solanum verrucosum]